MFVKMKKSSIIPLLSAAILLFFGACKNPFQSGLGDKIDINRPEVKLVSPVPGDFLQDTVTFSGTATDDSGVAAVKISFDGGATWNDVNSYDAGTKIWQHNMDTTTYLNGTIKIRVRVIDDSGKRTDTEELVFTIDNAAPLMEIQVPAINPATYNPLTPPDVAMNGTIVGLVTDLQGVAVGYPQIKFWKPSEDPEPADWDDTIGVGEVRQASDFRYRLSEKQNGRTGEFYLRLQAMDVSGGLTVLPPLTDDPYIVNLISGDTLPVVNFAFTAGDITTVSGNSYVRSDYRFQVTATHPNGIASVELSRSRNSGVSIPFAWDTDDTLTPMRTFGSPVFPVNADKTDDGAYEFRIVATSSGTGSETELYRSVIVDATPPEVEITNLRPTVIDSTDPGNPIEQINGTIQINAAAGDSNGLEGVKWWMQPSANPAPTAYTSAGGTLFTATPYAHTLNSTEYTNNTEYTFYIIARDRAGNDKIIDRDITVKQATDDPAVTFTDLDPAITTAGAAGVGGVNLLDTNARVRGTIEDDDLVDPSSIRIKLNGGAWVPIESKGLAGKSVAFSHNVDSLGQGVHRFELEFSDDPSAKLGASPPTNTVTVGPIYFVIDTAPPAITVTSPGPGTYQRAFYSLTGTAVDANTLATWDFGGMTGVKGFVEIESPEAPAVWVKAPVDSGTNVWTYTVGEAPSLLFGGAWEGARTVSVRASDRFGKQATVPFIFTVDTVAPTAAITAPLAIDWLSGASGSAQGTAADAGSGVFQVRFWIGNTVDTPPASTDDWSIASGTTSWNGSVNLSALGEGAKTLHVRARDGAGNWSGAVTRNFGVDQSPPTLTETTIGSPAVGRNAMFSLGGAIADANALKSLVVTQSKGAGPAVEVYRNDALSGTGGPWTLANLPRDPDAPDPKLPAAFSLVDGVYTYTITVTDVALKTAVAAREVRVDLVGPEVIILNPASGAAVQGTALSINGTSEDVESVSGIAGVRYYLATPPTPPPADYLTWTAATGGSIWSSTLNFVPGAEGSRILHVVAQDTAGNWSAAAETVNFTIDQAPPEIQAFAFGAGTINTVGGNSYARADFSFSFTAFDSNALANVLITRNGTEVFNGNYSTSSQLVSFPQTVGGAGLTDGIYEYIITVTDLVGKTVSLTRAVVVDTSGPLTEITSLTPLLTITGVDYVNGTIRFTASASDDNGLTGVKWWLIPSVDTPPADYEAAGGTAFAAAPYTETRNTALLTNETEYTLYIIARDRALNDTVISRSFTVDQATDTPLVTVTHPSPSSYVDGGYTVRGTAADDDGVAPASVQVRYHDGSAWSGWQNASVSGSGREVSFTYVLPGGLGADGAKMVQAHASDDPAAKIGGDTAVVGASPEVSFTLDSLAPIVTVAVPAQNSARRVTFTISGEVTETNLDTVRLNMDGGTYSDTLVAGAGDVKTWSLDIDSAVFDALAEGPHTITVEASDLVGRNHTLQRVFYKDTAGPVISFTSIVEGDSTIVVEPVPVLRGSFSDEYSNTAAVFEYRLNSTLEADPWSVLAVTGSGKTVSWAIPVDALADGAHIVDIRVADATGNSSTTEDVAFRIDRAVPSISVSSPASGTIFGTVAAGNVFTLTGTASDANLVSVKARLGSGADFDITGTIVGGTSTWNFPVAKADFDALADGPRTVTLTAVDAAGRTAEQVWNFTKDTAPPDVVFNNIESDGTTVLFETDPRVLGGVSDTLGVYSMESRAEKYDYGTLSWNLVQDWTSLGAAGGQNVVSWSKSFGSTGLNQTDGRYRIAVRALDGATPDANERISTAVEFRIDRANPALSVNSSGIFQSADFGLTGTASDLNTIVGVRGKVGDTDFSSGTVANAATSDGFATWSLTVPTGGLVSGSYTVYVQAEDSAGRTAVLSREFTLDDEPPQVVFSEPISGTRVNGLVTVRGTSSDDNAVALVQYRIGKNATTWQTAGLGGGLYSWSYTFSNINTYANTADVTEIDPITGLPDTGTNVWALPIQARVVDVAGNVTEELSYRLYVDPDRDAPTVTVISPANDQIVGGEVRVSGFSSDDDWVHSVQMRVDPTGTGTSYGAWENTTLVNQGTQVNWFKNINSSGDLNPPAGTIRDVRIQIRAYDSKDYGVTEGIGGDITELNVKFDSGVPVIENVRIYRNGTEVAYAPGVRAAGTFAVRATVRDEGGIASIKWKGEGQPVFTDILANPAITTPPVEVTAGNFEIGRKYLITSLGTTNFTAIGASSNTVGISFVAGGLGSGTGSAYESAGPLADPALQYFVYAVELTIDSQTVNSGQYADTSGFYSLDLQATDNATPTPYLTQTNLNIQIDNYFPLGEYTSSASAATANYYVQGRAWDSGTLSGSIQGIDRVVVYFYRNGGYINLNGGAFNGTTLTVKDMTAGGMLQSVPFPADKFSGITINNNEVTVDLDGDGYIEGFTDDGIYKNWFAVFNTNQLADGPVELNYVVIDRAGNATRHVQSLYIRNNAPIITGVVLGTDVNGDLVIGDTASGESRLIGTGYGATNFTARHNRLSFSVNAAGGNDPKRYSVGYVTGTSSVLATALVPGGVYTIEAAGDTNWTLVGAGFNTAGTTFVATGPGTGTGTATGYTTVQKNVTPYTANAVVITDFTGMPDSTVANDAKFVIKVYDSTVAEPPGTEADQLSDAVVIGLNIDNVDNVAPSLVVASFGRRYTVPTSNRDADKTLEDVDLYTENIVTTGSGSSLVKHGYVQYATPSGDGEADASGKVIFLGKAEDNQRIAKITAQIPGFNLGAEFDIALWDGSALSAASAGHAIADVAAGTADWGFETVSGSQAITEAYGHVLNWKFAWNTAAITTVTAPNVTAVFRAYDAGPSGGNTTDDDITVDVVPYITKISNPVGQGGLSDTVIRSSNGLYGMESHATNYFRVSGFNLTGAVAHVSAAPISVQPGTPNLTVVPTATATTADIRKNFSTSGYLTLFVNGIPSINNINAVGEAYHSEAVLSEPRSTLWNDDRYLSMWSLTQTLPAVTNQTFYYPSMVMNGNQPLFSYANDNDGYTYRMTDDVTTVQKGGRWFERHTALARNSDGSYWILSAEDAFSGLSMGYLYLNRDNSAGAVYGILPNAPGTDTNFFEIIGLDYTSRQMNRIRHPKLIVEGPNTASNIYITYYDSHPSHRELSFVSFRATDATNSNLTQPANDAARATQVQVIPNTSGASSEYYDMVKIGTGEIAVAYFDETAGVLKLQYSGNAWDANNLSGGGTWTEMTVDDSPLTGSHVSMAVGQRGATTYLYLAYHDAAETALKFAEINWTTKAVTKVVVDNRFSVGTRTNVFVIDDLPYVSFYSDSYSGTRNSVRLAYPVPANGRTAAENITMPGADVNEEYTGNWEVAAVPTVTVPKGGIEQFNRTQLNTYENGTTNQPVVAWLADRIEYAKLQPPAP